MSARSVSLIAGALLLTTGLAVAGRSASSGWSVDSGEQAPSPGPEIEVLIAESELPKRTLFMQEHPHWQPWPDGEFPPEGHLLKGQIKLAHLYGSALRRDVPAGQAILYDLIVRPRDPEFLAIAPRPGYQAYTLPVTGRVTRVEPARAGDQIAVLLRHVRSKDETIVTRVSVFPRNVGLLALVRS